MGKILMGKEDQGIKWEIAKGKDFNGKRRSRD
jgi:hypothetical protein